MLVKIRDYYERTLVKNQLIFEYASGRLGPSKSIFTSTYLYLNSKASNINRTFENMLGDNLIKNSDTPLEKIKYSDCMTVPESNNNNNGSKDNSPITKVVGPLNKINWKQVYKGFKEFSLNIEDNDEIKLIKMDPGISVPLHSHGGKEYILVLVAFATICKYNKGDIQINDQQVKHTPIACEDDGCICLSITEKDAIFFGKFGSFLNLFTFVRSFFK